MNTTTNADDTAVSPSSPTTENDNMINDNNEEQREPTTTYLTPKLDNIPQLLKEKNSWVCWKLEYRGSEKPTKPPIDAHTGQYARTNDETTWSDFETAKHYYLTHTDSMQGIGLRLVDNIVAVDLDNCVKNKVIDQWALDIVKMFNSYTEMSPSTNGIRIIALGRKPVELGKIQKVGSIELYDNNSAKYCTITGVVKSGFPNEPQERQEAINTLYADMLKSKEQPIARSSPISLNPLPLSSTITAEERCRKYIAKMPDAISGQDGHGRTYHAACVCYQYGLDDETAMRVMTDFNNNKTGGTLWTEKEIRHKLSDAKVATIANGEFGSKLNSKEQKLSNASTDKVEALPIVVAPELSIDLSVFPELLQQAVSALSQENPKMPAVCHIMPCISLVGTLIGKHLYTRNMGQYYYPNIWAVVLAPTAENNKSGSRNIIQDAIGPENLLSCKPTFQALYSSLGHTINKKDWQAMTLNERRGKKKELLEQSQSDLVGMTFLSDECTGTLKHLMGGWDSRSPQKNIDDVINLGDPTYQHESPTVNDGFRCMYDLCLSFCGFTQNETWEREMAGDTMKTIGLFARIIPSTTAITLTNTISVGETYSHVVNRIKCITDKLAYDKVECSFGVDLTKNIDPIKMAMDELEQTEEVKYFKEVYPDNWKIIKSKVITHAIKLSMICAVLDSAFIVKIGNTTSDGFSSKTIIDAPLDCSKWFKDMAYVLVKHFIAYFESLGKCQNKKEAKIIELLKRYGYMSGSDLQNAIRLWGRPWDDFSKSLLEDGKISRLRRTDNPDKYKAVLKQMNKNYNCCSDLYFRI